MTVYGDGRQTRDFTFVGDVVAATRAAANVPQAVGGVYNVGGGARVSLIEALRLIEEISEREVEIQYLESEHGDVRDTGADITAARAELGYSPRVALEAGLAAEFEWITRSVDKPGAGRGPVS